MDFDLYTVEEIKLLIAAGIVTEQEVVDHYNNEWWNETP